MKKLLRLKAMLLLCALIAGSGSVWAEDATVTITRSSFGDGTGNYASYDWTADGVSGKGQIYATTTNSIQMNGNNANGKFIYNTTGINGKIKKINIIKASGSNISFSVYGRTSAYTGSGDYGTLISTANIQDGTGRDYTVSTGNYDYFVVLNAGKAAYISSITITYEKALAYTITPTVNETLMGSVSVDGATITAAPNNGYRVKAGAEGYTVTSGTATVAHEGYSNTLTVTPSTDCTVRINFEAIPSHTLSYEVSPVGAGSVTFGETSVKEGTTTTATAYANAGYKFTGWSIADGDKGAVLSSTSTNPTTVIMGTADATVTATFDAVTTYGITWNVNGKDVRTDNVEENTTITFPTSISGIPAGYELKGWSTATVLTPQNTVPATKVTSATSTANVTYYAILAVKTASGPDTYEQLSSDDFEVDATYVIGGKQSSSVSTMYYLKSYENVDEDSSWGIATSTPATVAPITFTLSGTAAALVAQDNSGNYLKKINDKKFGMSATSTTVYIADDGSIRESSTGSYLRYNYNTGNGGFRWYAGNTTGTQAYFFKVVSGDVYDNFCTTVPDIDVTVSAAEYATFSDYAARDFSESGITVYTAKAKGTSVALTEVTDGIVPANTGVVLYKAGGTASAQSIPAVATEKTTLEDNEMMANVERTSIKQTAANGNTNYILANESSVVGFYLAATDGAYLNAHRAYLSTSTVAGAREFLGFDMDDTTGIMDTNHETMTNNGEYFNLAGQRVAQPAKGLYIVNGKKIVIR